MHDDPRLLALLYEIFDDSRRRTARAEAALQQFLPCRERRHHLPPPYELPVDLQATLNELHELTKDIAALMD